MNKTQSVIPFVCGAFTGILAMAVLLPLLGLESTITPSVMTKATKICESVGGLAKLEQDYGFISGTCKDGSTVKLR